MPPEYFILDIDHYYQSWRIVNGVPCALGDKSRTIEPSLHRIQPFLTDDSVTFLTHRFADPLDTNFVSSQLGRCYQCSVDFTMHDAAYYAAVKDKSKFQGDVLGIVDTGVSSYAETISFYVNHKIKLRGFNVNKSIELFIAYCLAEARLFDLEGIHAVGRDDARKILKFAEEHVVQMYKDIYIPTRLRSEYDTLTYQGAEVLYRINCNKLITKLHSKLYRSYIDKGVTSLFVFFVVRELMIKLLAVFKFDTLILGGDLFKRSWVNTLIGSITDANIIIDSSHPGLGMYYLYLEQNSE